MATFAVVGCRDCRALWIVEGQPETTGCPRCGTRSRFDQLRRFAETDAIGEARRIRAALLADRSDGDGSFAGLDPDR